MSEGRAIELISEIISDLESLNIKLSELRLHMRAIKRHEREEIKIVEFQCEMCGKSLLKGGGNTGSGRITRKFCSNACRIRHHRKKDAA